MGPHVSQPRAHLQPTSEVDVNRGRPRRKSYYIDQSHISFNKINSIRVHEKVVGRVKSTIFVNNKPIEAVFDSGNTFRCCGNEKLMADLNLTPQDLQPLKHSTVGTASRSHGLTILGESKQPLSLEINGLPIVFRCKLAFVKELEHPLNIGSDGSNLKLSSGPARARLLEGQSPDPPRLEIPGLDPSLNIGVKFLKQIGCNWDFKLEALHFDNISIPLSDDFGDVNPHWSVPGNHKNTSKAARPAIGILPQKRDHARERPSPQAPISRASVVGDHILQPGEIAAITLCALDHKLRGGEPVDVMVQPHLTGSKSIFQKNTREIFPAYNVVSYIDGSNYHLTSEVINLSNKKQTLKNGVEFGQLFELDKAFTLPKDNFESEDESETEEILNANTPLRISRIEPPHFVKKQQQKGELLFDKEKQVDDSEKPPPFSTEPIDLTTLSGKQYKYMYNTILDRLNLDLSPFCQSKEVFTKLVALLLQYYHVFSFNGEIGKTDLIEHSIELIDNTPIKQPYR